MLLIASVPMFDCLFAYVDWVVPVVLDWLIVVVLFVFVVALVVIGVLGVALVIDVCIVV